MVDKTLNYSLRFYVKKAMTGKDLTFQVKN